MRDYKFTISGRPITKKAHQRIVYNKNTGRRYVIQSKYYIKFEQRAMFELLAQKPKRTITGQVDICVKYWMPDKRSYPDLTGLIQATGDVLQKSGIISNDKNIRRWGIGYEHSKIMGIDRKNPRQEITLKEVE
jgi:Holliday junction resolvase RusA-like endonuclease